MQNESYNHESIEQMRAQLRRQAEMRKMQEGHGGQYPPINNPAQHQGYPRVPHAQPEPPRPTNVIGIIGLAAAVTALLFRDQPAMTVLFWIAGFVASFIGLFFRHRIWGILGFLVSMIPIMALVFWVGTNYEQLVEDGYFGETAIFESSNSQATSNQRGDETIIHADQEGQKTLQQPASKSAVQPKPKATTAKTPQKQVNYIEIKGPKGYVNVYIGMPKEEVKALLGRADDVSVMTLGNEIHETWTYRGSNYLMIRFVNGKLDGIY